MDKYNKAKDAMAKAPGKNTAGNGYSSRAMTRKKKRTSTRTPLRSGR